MKRATKAFDMALMIITAVAGIALAAHHYVTFN